jgi:hypothetical protein
MSLAEMPEEPARGNQVLPADAERRRRWRNLAMLIALVALCLLFYAITLVKLSKG